MTYNKSDLFIVCIIFLGGLIIGYYFRLMGPDMVYANDYTAYGPVKGTGSMLPMITPRSTLYYDNIESPNELDINDVAVYQRNNTFIVHRIISKYDCDNQTYFIFKGDNNIAVDEPSITFKDIKRKVIGVEYR